MNDNDEQKTSHIKDDDLDTPEGLGHDPLEWLQEDEEEVVLETPAASEAETNPEPAAAAPEVSAETEVMPEPEPEEPKVIEEAAPSAEPVADAASENQSFTFDNHKAILTLPEKLTVQIIEPLHSEWKTLLYDLPQSLEIDASQVMDVDAAGMQLFYALVQQMVFKGSDVVILNVQPALKRHFELFGLQDFFSQYTHAA